MRQVKTSPSPWGRSGPPHIAPKSLRVRPSWTCADAVRSSPRPAHIGPLSRRIIGVLSARHTTLGKQHDPHQRYKHLQPHLHLCPSDRRRRVRLSPRAQPVCQCTAANVRRAVRGPWSQPAPGQSLSAWRQGPDVQEVPALGCTPRGAAKTAPVAQLAE
jgi:hypothetical protein